MRSTAKRKVPIERIKTQGGTCICKPNNLYLPLMKKLILILLLSVSYGSEAQQVLPTDKLLHLGGGYTIGATATSITYYYTQNKKTSMIVGISAVLIAGIGKELWDIKHGSPETMDLLADVVGGTLGILTVKINF
tara:strand:- start:1002 stop:1406 length:405 start_codon:yes stop_codon:yes gene_type:complete